MYNIFFIDPMSYSNLEYYDKGILSNFPNTDVLFLGNVKIESNPVNIKSKLIYNYSDKQSFFKFFYYLISNFKLLFLILKFNPKVLHFQWFKLPLLDFYFLKVIKMLKPNIKVLFTAHNILPHDSGNKFKSIFYKLYNLVDAIIVHDDYSKKTFLSIFDIKSDKINVIRHGLLKIPRDENKVNLNSTKFSFLNDKIIFLFIGHITKYKGIDLLIDTWNQSVELNSNEKIHLIVAGNDKNNFLKKINNFHNVTIIDKFLSNEEFISFINLSDVIILPYLKISQSGVLMTVLHEKKRVLVSNTGGLVEPLKYSDIGWVLEKLNVESFKNLILKITRDIKKTDNISDFKKIKDHYSWDVISNKTYELYLKLI
jgi:glycosyltransferase involved in cell wall biosynthesis